MWSSIPRLWRLEEIDEVFEDGEPVKRSLQSREVAVWKVGCGGLGLCFGGDGDVLDADPISSL